MSVKFELHGMDELKKKLEEAAKSISGPVSFSELFPTDFMNHYTNFSSFDELLTNGGFKVESQEDFRAIPDDLFDEHIAQTTKFENWEEMKQCAGTEYAKKNLKL